MKMFWCQGIFPGKFIFQYVISRRRMYQNKRKIQKIVYNHYFTICEKGHKH